MVMMIMVIDPGLHTSITMMVPAGASRTRLLPVMETLMIISDIPWTFLVTMPLWVLMEMVIIGGKNLVRHISSTAVVPPGHSR